MQKTESFSLEIFHASITFMVDYSYRRFVLFLAILKNYFKHLWFTARYKKKNILEAHFAFWSSSNHINRAAFEHTINLLGNQEARIIETGTAAWGTNSTRLWDAYIKKNGGSLVSVDIRFEASARLIGQLSKMSKCEVSDSVNYLRCNKHIQADLYFLDSWDVDWANPHDSALHGLAEFEALPKNMRFGTLVLIDDTPASTLYIPSKFHSNANQYFETHHVWPGKGALVLKQISKSNDFEVIFHEYALLLRKK